MTKPVFRMIDSNGIRIRVAEAGSGPLVLMVHGFPESWAAWRHQIGPLAAAGYHVLAMDCRGYGGSDKPDAITAYDMEQMTADIAGILHAEGGGQPGILIGHDWGAALVWHATLLFPQLVRGVAALSVPFTGVWEQALLDVVKPVYADRGLFFYQDYFQQPGVAEAEIEADLDHFVRAFYYWISGDAPEGLGHKRPASSRLLDGLPAPDPFPDWLPPKDLQYLVDEFARSGLRGPLNRYRNQHRDVEFLQPWRGQQITRPALFIAGLRDLVLSMAPGVDLVAEMRRFVPDLRDAVLLPGCGHWTQQERPAEVTQALLNWLRDLDD